MTWRTEVLEPAAMTTDDIRAELRHDLDVYERAADPVSRAAMGRRIERLVAEMDKRAGVQAKEPAIDHDLEREPNDGFAGVQAKDDPFANSGIEPHHRQDFGVQAKEPS